MKTKVSAWLLFYEHIVKIIFVMPQYFFILVACFKNKNIYISGRLGIILVDNLGCPYHVNQTSL